MYQKYLHNPQLPGRSLYHKGNHVGVLLFHGATATTNEIRPLATALIKQGYTISCPLLPGHGTDPHILNQVRVADYISYIEQSYQQIKQDCHHVIVGGMSVGALLALYLAAEHQEISGVLAYVPALRLEGLRSYGERIMLSIMGRFISTVPKKKMELPEMHQAYRVRSLRGLIELTQFQRVMYQRLPDIQQPVLLVSAGSDRVIQPESIQDILDIIPDGIVHHHHIEDAEHVIMLGKHQQDVIETTQRFIHGLVCHKVG